MDDTTEIGSIVKDVVRRSNTGLLCRGERRRNNRRNAHRVTRSGGHVFVGGRLGYWLLRRIKPAPAADGTLAPSDLRLDRLLGAGLRTAVRDRIVIDWGCGEGNEAVALAQFGARRVIGLDIRPHALAAARSKARALGLQDTCEFTTHTDQRADVILSIDAFEHFSDPAAILRGMAERLAPDGRAWISFGPPWLHPLGGHLFSVFPWAHLVFTETALIRWRSDFRSDGATRFEEVEGGLNRMTIRRFERLVRNSPLQFESFETVPIGVARRLHKGPTREFLTSIVRCRLVHGDAEG
jgi:SAM-dependent methyltransferase